jgi:diguanylate cyclase (GGDEF)-like protein
MNLSPAEALLFHLANRYLRQLMPAEYLDELQGRFNEAERQVNAHPETAEWSQRVLWLSHWDGVLSNHPQPDATVAMLSTALLHNKQVSIHYQGKYTPFNFNLFGLVKRDQNLLVVGSYWQHNDPFVLSVRKILAVELTDHPAIQPAPDFDLQDFLHRQLNFPHTQVKLQCLQIEFSEDMHSYVLDHALEADQFHITAPADYHHIGYFLLEARGVVDGERLRQWISGFSHKAQVLKPDELRLVMEQARLDTRTNLFTATEFKRCLKREIQRCLRDPHMTFGLLILDLDHFKLVNDHNGHDFGDKVLLQVANCIRDYDEAARHGGEEFSILLPDTNAAEALVIAERIRKKIEQQTLQNGEGNVVPVTTSIGLAVYPDDLPTELKALIGQNRDIAELSGLVLENIFHQADQALYQAKEQGRNRVCLAANLI